MIGYSQAMAAVALEARDVQMAARAQDGTSLDHDVVGYSQAMDGAERDAQMAACSDEGASGGPGSDVIE